MENLKNINGKCLCGSVELTVKEAKREIGVCHCSWCRTWSAGPFLGLDCGTEVTFNNEEQITIFDSSDWAERGFCKDCGTNIFYRFKETKQVIISSEIFNLEDLHMDHQIFIDEKPAYYDFSNKTKNMTGTEVIAAFEAKD